MTCRFAAQFYAGRFAPVPKLFGKVAAHAQFKFMRGRWDHKLCSEGERSGFRSISDWQGAGGILMLDARLEWTHGRCFKQVLARA